MSFSLNEIQTLARKATRGAGYPWALADEAAWATRWLCARDLSGCEVLARLLEQPERKNWVDHQPTVDPEGWHACGRALCPLTTGAAISDRADSLSEGEVLLIKLNLPLMVLPFVSQAAQVVGRPVSVSGRDFLAATDGDQIFVEGRDADILETATVRVAGDAIQPAPRRTRADPDAATLDTLLRFAHRTYAPATEESRLKGAGAGLSDND